MPLRGVHAWHILPAFDGGEDVAEWCRDREVGASEVDGHEDAATAAWMAKPSFVA